MTQRSTVLLRPRAPFRLDFTAWALRRLPTNEMDRWAGATYRRVLVLSGGTCEVAVEQEGDPADPRILVTMACGCPTVPGELEEVVTRLFGLEVDLTPFYRLAADHPRLERLARSFLGLRPPCFPSVFEGLVNGIACQQLSLNVGISLLNRLAAAYGARCPESPKGTFAFPTPDQLASADPAHLRSLGFSVRKAENIVELARAVSSGRLDVERLRRKAGAEGLDDAAALSELDRIPGVGRWTAEYVALRGAGRLDVFPGDDVGAQNRLKDWFSLNERPGYEATARLLEPFKPYRGLIYFHLLLEGLAESGSVERAR